MGRGLLGILVLLILSGCGFNLPVDKFSGNSDIHLNITSLNGTVEVVPQKASYKVGDSVELTAKGNDGFYFLSWEGGGDGIDYRKSLTLTADTNLTAHFFNPLAQNQFYVSPSGTSGGNGTMGSPWDLQTALNHPAAVKSGDIIWLRGGQYIGRYDNKLVGSDTKPIVVRSYPGERAVLDSNVPIPTYFINEELAAGGPDQLVTFQSDSPSVGMLIKVGNETINIYSNFGNRYGAARGWNGTTREFHAAGAQAYRIINGTAAADLNGENTWFWDLEFTNTDTYRNSSETGSHPEEITRNGITVFGRRIKLVNCYIHDLANGIGAQGGGEEFESYGSILLNNGWNAPDRGHGHGIYTQNKTGKYKLYRDNLVLPNFGLGLQQYGSDEAFLDHFIWDGNVFALDRILFGGGKAYTDITLRDNMSYGVSPELGYSAENNTDALILRNYFDGLNIKYFTEVEAKYNTFFRSAFRGAGSVNFIIYSSTPATYDFAKNDMDYNLTYSNYPGPNLLAFTGPRVGGQTLAQWRQSTGYEMNGTVINAAKPSANKIIVKPNAYDKNLAFITVYNWQNLASVLVDLAGILQNGDEYELRSFLNFEGEVETGTYSSSTGLQINMTGRSIVQPIGWAQSLIDDKTPYPEFGVFQLRRK